MSTDERRDRLKISVPFDIEIGLTAVNRSPDRWPEAILVSEQGRVCPPGRSRGGFVRRALAVHYVPCALFVTCLYALVRAGSFSGRSDWSTVVPSNQPDVLGALLLISACAAVLGMLLYPFQVRAVRVLEGYWDRWPVTAGMAGVLVEMQRRRQWALLHAASRPGPVATDARRRHAMRPPADALLPTALGNALRAGELGAGERYGLTTLSSWPHIYMQVSDRLLQALRSTRDVLDMAVNLCWSFLAVSVVLAVGLFDEPAARLLPVASLCLAAVAYKGAIVAAQAYSALMHVVFDLHRFDLLKALHRPLPSNGDREREVFTQLSMAFAGRRATDLPYEHGASPAAHDRAPGSCADDADRTADT